MDAKLSLSKRTPGEVLLEAGLAEEALQYLLREHEREPERWEHLSNLGSAYRIIGQLDRSLECLERALSLNTQAPQAWHNLSNTLEDLGRFEQSLGALHCAFDLRPSRETGISLAFSLLREGKWEEGFPLYEFGRVGRSWSPIAEMPVWHGWDPRNKRLLVVREGGYGDSFMLLRYFKNLDEMGCEVSFLVWDAQKGIFDGHPWIKRVIPESAAFDGRVFDFHCSIMSLPFLLDANPQNTEPMGGYIKAREDLKRKASLALSNGGKKRIGVCWKAQEAAMPKKTRSIPVSDLSLLRDLPARFISLVKGEPCPEWIENRPELNDSWEQTAATIDSLDLIISADTAVAHLAGAMGKPVVTVLPLNSEWQWLRGTSRTVWYESMTLIRNTDPYSFDPAVRELKEVIRGFLH